MPLIHAEKYGLVIGRYYGRFDEEIHAPVAELLSRNPKLRSAIERFLSQMLQHYGENYVKQAVLAKTMVVRFQINLVKHADTFWGKLPGAMQQKVSAQTMLIAMELLLEESAFLVEKHTLTYQQPILIDDEEFEEDEDSEEIEVPAIGDQGAGDPSMLLDTEPEPAPVVPENTGATGSGDGMDLDTPFVLTTEEIQIGAVYGNGKGIHRRVDSFAEGRVKYTVVQGKGNVKAGAEGESSYKSFVHWSNEVISDPPH